MALFFDAKWFDAKLASAGLSRAQLAVALGLSETQIAEIWKDQRELSAREVATLASLLNAAPEEIAVRAGVSTPVPAKSPKDLVSFAEALADLAARIERLERATVEIKSLLLDMRHERR